MNSCDTPVHESEPLLVAPASAAGKPSPACGSSNTTRDRFARKRLNLIYLVLLGWVYLLLSGAFAKRTDFCRDCGELNRYKSAGSWIAMAILWLFALLVVVGLLAESQPS